MEPRSHRTDRRVNVSYDLAVWEGEMPNSDYELNAALEMNMAILNVEPAPEPTTRIRTYVEALLARWPDLDFDNEDEDEDETPWADGPMMNNAAGPIIYFAMVYSKAEEAAEFAAQLASEHGLVCFDPQLEALRN